MSSSIEKQFDTLQMEPSFKMIARRPRARKLAPALRERIDTLWAEEQEQLGGSLFDGKIFSAIEASSFELVGEFVSYKNFVACQRDPEIAEQLGIEAVAVTGITSLEGSGSILVGRRSRTCLQDRNCFELLPSGGIDADCCTGDEVFYQEQLYRELEEETNLGRDMVRGVKPYLLTFEKERRIWELCLHMVVAKDSESIICCRRKEHQELLWLSRRDVVPFLRMHRGAIVPLTELLLTLRPSAATRMGV
jgi:hypothetical protein